MTSSQIVAWGLTADVAVFTAITGLMILSGDEPGRRKAADEATAVTEVTFYFELRVVPVQYMFHDRQPEPRTTAFLERPASTR